MATDHQTHPTDAASTREDHPGQDHVVALAVNAFAGKYETKHGESAAHNQKVLKWTRRAAIAGVIYTFLSFVIAGAGIWAAYESRIAANASKAAATSAAASAGVAETQARLAIAANVRPIKVNLGDIKDQKGNIVSGGVPPQTDYIDIYVRNQSTIPIPVVGFSFKWAPYKKDELAAAPIYAPEVAIDTVIPPGAPPTNDIVLRVPGDIQLTPGDAEDLRSGTKRLTVWGYIHYENWRQESEYITFALSWHIKAEDGYAAGFSYAAGASAAYSALCDTKPPCPNKEKK